MRKVVQFAALIGAMPTISVAAPRQHVRIDYMLPATTVTAGVQQRITNCPASADVQAATKEAGEPLRAEFAWKAALVAKQTPNRLVQLDTETGFLVDRETKIHFADDWYLKDFNGKTTGQGGPLVVSLVKAGAAIFAMTANPLIGVGAGIAAAKANTAYFGETGIRISGLLPPAPRPRST